MFDFLKKIKLYIFDVDGTLVLGEKALPYASDVIELLKKNNFNFIILSNNSSYSIEENLKRLETILKVTLSLKNLYTSTHATIDFISKKNIRRCFIVGTPGMIQDFTENGIIQDTENPQAIILGFDKTLNYNKIQKTAFLLQKNPQIPFFATHPDLTCPTEEGDIPDVGSFLKMFEAATGRSADIIFGKPNELILEQCISKFNLDFSEVLVVGDRLETDILMANSLGTRSALVLTGDTSAEDLNLMKNGSTLIWEDLGTLYNYLKNL